MNIYFWNILLIILHGICYKIFYPKKKHIFIWIVTIQNIFLMGLRHYQYVGIDLGRYQIGYTLSERMTIADRLISNNFQNIMYIILTYIFSSVGVDYQTFLFIISAFVVGIMGWFINKYSNDVILSYFVYLGLGVYTFQFSGLKQALAMSMLLLTYDVQQKGENKQAFVLFIVACLFHPTAVVYLLYVLGRHIKINKLTVLGIILGCGAVYFGRNHVGSLLMILFADEHIGRYASTNTIGSTTIFLIALLCLYTYSNYGSIKRNIIANSSMYMLSIAVFIQILSSFSYLFTRLNLYYVQFAVIYVPLALTGKNLKHLLKQFYYPIKFLVWLILIAIMINQYFSHIEVESLDMYKFYWE